MGEDNSKSAELRRLAEKRLHTGQRPDQSAPAPQELPKLFHALEVQQIELEMQNEELQRNQVQLELACDRYAQLFDFAPVGYFKLNPDGRILQVNLTGSELLGSERAQLRDQNFFHFVATEYKDVLFKHLRRVFKNPARHSCETQILQQDGSSFFAKLDSVEQLDTAGDSRQCLTLVTDISRLKKIEAENQRAKEAAENANQAKSHFLAAASHDLRQPLQAMTTITDLLKMKLEGEELFWLVNNLSKSLANMSELFNALLNVSQLESGTIIPEIKDFPVNELFQQLVNTHRPIAEHKAVKLHVAECSATIRSDPLLLGQILDNLVSNAIRYTESGKVLLGCRHRGILLRIDVWDTGIGIPEDQQEHIFEEFYQLDNPARDRRKGLGLGLSIVKRISRLLQHEIKQCAWAEGSLFSVEVPLAGPALGSHPQSNRDIEQAANKAVSLLIIDDNNIVLYSLTHLLRSYGYQVTGAIDRPQALALIENGAGPFDFIISDYRLREGDTGIALIQAAREALGEEIPALIVTGDMELSTIQKIEAAGLAILQKPVQADTLDTKIQQMLAATSS